MNKTFVMNGYLWRAMTVDAESPVLIDRTYTQRVATTDPNTLCIYLSDELEGEFLRTVLVHELAHCVMFSFHMLRTIHLMVEPRYWYEAEEWICNFIANYGSDVFDIARYILDEDVLGDYI